MHAGEPSQPNAAGAGRPAAPKVSQVGETASAGPSRETPAQRRPAERTWWTLIRATFVSWWQDNAIRLGASLAFYAVFSTAPLLIIAVLIVGLVYGPGAAQGRIAEQLQGVMGQDAARGVQTLIATTHRTGGGSRATALSMLALIIGASSAFSELQSALNLIWKVRAKPSASWWMTIRNRALIYVMVLCIGLLMLGMLAVSSAADMLWKSVGTHTPLSSTVLHGVNFVAMLFVETFLFAMVFKFLPDAHIAWRDVWLGAFVTAVLIAVGNLLIGVYLNSSAIESAYGAAGSLAIFLLWTYYSALILYLGAEFTQVYARMFGSQIIPEAHAEEIPSRQPARDAKP